MNFVYISIRYKTTTFIICILYMCISPFVFSGTIYVFSLSPCPYRFIFPSIYNHHPPVSIFFLSHLIFIHQSFLSSFRLSISPFLPFPYICISLSMLYLSSRIKSGLFWYYHILQQQKKPKDPILII